MEILVVDDELVALKKMEILLQSLGHETLAAKDGLEGWQFWEKRGPG